MSFRLSSRRTSVQPDGAAIAMSVEYWPGELMRKPRLAIITLFCAVPVGLLMVRLPVLVLPAFADPTKVIAPPPEAVQALTDSSGVIVPALVIAMVLSSVAAVAPPEPAVTSCRLLADDAAVKFVNLRPATVT